MSRPSDSLKYDVLGRDSKLTLVPWEDEFPRLRSHVASVAGETGQKAGHWGGSGARRELGTGTKPAPAAPTLGHSSPSDQTREIPEENETKLSQI